MILAVATLSALLQACAPAVSADTMRAIVMVESRGFSYAINDDTARVTYCVPSAPVYPCSRKVAAYIAIQAIRKGHSVDVGIAQVNSSNFRNYGASVPTMLEPCENLQVGSAILANAYRQSAEHFGRRRDALWHAIMAYNSGSLYAGENYVRSVMDEVTSRGQASVVPSVAMLTDYVPALQASRPSSLYAQSKPSATSRAKQSLKDPRLAPLAAQGVGYPGGRTQITESLSPALAH